MAGIQLIGKDHVLDAFNEFEEGTWALFQGKQLLISGNGADTLDTWLDRFMPAASTATYTLRIYDGDLPVKASTEYVAALNFKLNDPYQGQGIGGYSTKLMDRIDGLEKRLDGDSDDGDSITGILMGWLKDPEKLETGIGAIMQLMGKQPPNIPAPVEPQQAINGFKVSSDNTQDTDAKLELLAQVLDKLEKRDPKIVEHLRKVSELDPITFSMVIAKIDAL